MRNKKTINDIIKKIVINNEDINNKTFLAKENLCYI